MKMTPERKSTYIKQARIASGLNELDRENLNGIMRFACHSKGEIIFMPGDSANDVFILHSGKIKLSRVDDDGRELTLATITPGETFGEVDVLAEHPRDAIAEVVEDAVIGTISKKGFECFLKKHPQCSLNLSRLIGARVIRAEQRIKSFVFLDAPERLATLLLDMGQAIEVQSFDGHGIKVSCTHQGLANMIGTTRETVSIVLGQLQKAALIGTGNRFIRILNWNGYSKNCWFIKLKIRRFNIIIAGDHVCV